MKTIIHSLKISVLIPMAFLLGGFIPYYEDVLIPDAQLYIGYCWNETSKYQMNQTICEYEKESIVSVTHFDDIETSENDDLFKVTGEVQPLIKNNDLPRIDVLGNQFWDRYLLHRMSGKFEKYSFTSEMNSLMRADPVPVPLTNDVLINDNRSGFQELHNVAMAPDGSFVVCWQDDGDGNGAYQIFAAGFNSDGSKRWGDITVNKKSDGQQLKPAIAVADNGSFVVCWQDDNDGNGVYQIYAAGYNSNGSKSWGDITVNKNSDGQQFRPVIAMAPDGSFVVCWEDDADINNIYQIYAAGFNSNGSKRWGDITVNKNSDGQQIKPDIAMATDGSFTVCWQDDSDGNGVYQIYAAGFNSNGSKSWGDITVNKNSDGQQLKPSVAVASNGSFVVCWEDDADINNIYQIYAAGFNSNGSKSWSDITVNKNSDGQQLKPSIAMADNGSFIVCWEDDNDGNDVYQIYAAGFNSDGSKRWGDITVNKNSAGQQYHPLVEITTKGYTYRMAVVWEASYSNNYKTDLYGRLFSIENKLEQTIIFNSLPTKYFGDPSFNLTATASSGLPVTFSSSNINVATITGNMVTITGVGSTDIIASQAGNDVYNAVSVTLTLTVQKANQSIEFGPLPTKYFGDPSFNLTATASSGLPVTFSSSNINVATITGNTVTITGAGSTDITASQSGNDAYNAVSVTLTLTVYKANQSIEFGPLPTKYFGDPPFNLTATASSGLPVTFSSSNTNVATINGNTVTITGAGSTDITASQAGNDVYNAVSVTLTLTILSATGIHETSSREMNVYPNPTTGIVFIRSEKIIDNIYIYDLQGKRLYQYHQISNTATIDLNRFSSGLYIIRIQCGNKEYSQKIEKK